ncbi:minichromosome maintenance domain-containing protein 2 [Epargyreus clarus]|uniref:minichromosome maintenance domain-containing protein 2 n=1 Tax=Epargyreus clarus TaxID=520877 RepID=UPI003C2B03FD
METHCKLLLYLDRRRYLINMRDVCKDFIVNLDEKTIRKFPPLRFLLEIDVMDMYDLLPSLGDFLLREPLKWQSICNDIFYACFKSIDSEYVQNVESAQLAVILRLKSVPRYLSSDSRNSLKSISGLLVTISKPASYVYHTVWSCPEECEGNEVILHYIPKHPPKCYVCKSVLYENGGFRRCGEQVKATFKIKNSLLCKTFNIVDDLIPYLRLGARYILTTVILKKSIFVWSLQETNVLQAPITTPIPCDIKELFEACDGLPWKFIYCLASSIGVQISPLNCFMHVKINLLLSLASVKANILTNSSILHFLAAGHDTGYVGNLMKEAAKIADRHILLGNSNSSVSTSLIASSGGVCLMPFPFHTYNQKQTYEILSAIETGEISTSKAKIECAVWTQGNDFKKIVLYNVASIFGNVTRGDYGEYSDDLGDFILEQTSEPVKISNEEIEALKDVALYIDLVAGYEVSLDKATEALLSNYFLAARKERPKAVSIGSMNALVAICMTSARLCRRSVTNIQDAVFAIWLHVSGIPEPRFAPEEYLGTPGDIRRLQVIMSNFKGWLEQFTGSVIM